MKLAFLLLLISGCTTVHESKEWQGVTVSPDRPVSVIIDDKKFWFYATPTPEVIR